MNAIWGHGCDWLTTACFLINLFHLTYHLVPSNKILWGILHSCCHTYYIFIHTFFLELTLYKHINSILFLNFMKWGPNWKRISNVICLFFAIFYSFRGGEVTLLVLYCWIFFWKKCNICMQLNGFKKLTSITAISLMSVSSNVAQLSTMSMLLKCCALSLTSISYI